MTTRAAATGFPLRVGALLLTIATVALLVRSYDAPMALAPLAAVAALVPLLIRPQLAIYLTLFLLYINVPAVASQFYGVPDALAASVLLLLGIPLIGILVLRREPVRTGMVFHLMLGFLAVLLFSALFARELGLALGRIIGYAVEGLLLYWLVLNVVRTESALRRALWAVVLAGGVSAALSAYQAATGAHDRRFGGLAQHLTRVEYAPAEEEGGEPRLQIRISQRAAGPVGEPNRYAQVLLVLIPIAAVFARRARSRLTLAAATGCVGLLLVGVLLTYSRGALLTLALLLAAALYLRWLRPAHVAALGLVVLLVTSRLAPGLADRVVSLTGALDLVSERPTQADGAIRGRATEMLAALNVFLDHPVVGVGPGQYMPVYSVAYQQNLPVKYRDLQRPRRAHNLYLEIAAETGVLGLIAFLGIMGALAQQLLWARRYWGVRDPERAELATAFLLSLGVYLFTGLFLHLAFERYLWLLLALAGATVHTVLTPSLRRRWPARPYAERMLRPAPAAPWSAGGGRAARIGHEQR